MSGPRIVYFSSVTEATHQFVGKLGYPAERIPLLTKDETLTVGRGGENVVIVYGECLTLHQVLRQAA